MDNGELVVVLAARRSDPPNDVDGQGKSTRCTRSAAAAAWITLNRPEVRNALSGTLITEVYDHVANAQADDNGALHRSDRSRQGVLLGCRPQEPIDTRAGRTDSPTPSC